MSSTANKLASMIARASSFLPTRAASGWHAAVYECKLARLGRVTSRAEAEAELFESMPQVLDAVEKPKLELFLSMPKPPQAARTRDLPVMPPAWSMMSTPPASAHA
jgi:hypothetical protein